MFDLFHRAQQRLNNAWTSTLDAEVNARIIALSDGSAREAEYRSGRMLPRKIPR